MSSVVTKQASPSSTPVGLADLPPPDFFDPVIEAYKKDVDRTLLRENLKLTPAERSRNFLRDMKVVYEFQRAGQRLREIQRAKP